MSKSKTKSKSKPLTPKEKTPRREASKPKEADPDTETQRVAEIGMRRVVPRNSQGMALDTKAQWITEMLCALVDFDGFSDFGTEKAKRNMELLNAFNALKEAAENFTEKCFNAENRLRQWSRSDWVTEWAEYFKAIDEGYDCCALVDPLTDGFPNREIAKDYLTAPKVTDEVYTELDNLNTQGIVPKNGYLKYLAEQLKNDEASFHTTMECENDGEVERAKKRLELLSHEAGIPISTRSLRPSEMPLYSWALFYLRSQIKTCGFGQMWRWVKAVIPKDRIAGKLSPENNAWRFLKTVCESDEAKKTKPTT